jgi:hypothetical protein
MHITTLNVCPRTMRQNCFNDGILPQYNGCILSAHNKYVALHNKCNFKMGIMYVLNKTITITAIPVASEKENTIDNY